MFQNELALRNAEYVLLEELFGLLVTGGFFLGDFGHRLMLRLRIWTSETAARLVAARLAVLAMRGT
jgi:hypothetical protein